jgi:hypothetical protein
VKFIHPGFVGLFVKLDFDENRKGLCNHLIQLCGEFRPIDTLNPIKVLHHLPRLVCLKMANEMPGDIEALKGLAFGKSLLEPVFADVRNPAGDGLANGVRWDRFADGDQFDIGRISARSGGSLMDTVENTMTVIADSRHRPVGAVYEGVNELESSDISLLEKQGRLRHQ